MLLYYWQLPSTKLLSQSSEHPPRRPKRPAAKRKRCNLIESSYSRCKHHILTGHTGLKQNSCALLSEKTRNHARLAYPKFDINIGYFHGTAIPRPIWLIDHYTYDSKVFADPLKKTTAWDEKPKWCFLTHD